MLSTGSEYRRRIESQDRKIYVKGKEADISHPNLEPVINSIAYTYDLAKVKDLSVHSPLSDQEVNLLNHAISSEEELIKRYEYQRELSRELATCNYRCTGCDAINALYSSLEKEGKEKFEEILTEVQENDYACTGGLVDPKGDRTKRPTEQGEKYVRIVDEDNEGIYVSGAKIHQSGAFAADLTFVLPGRAFRSGEEDFAISFATMPEEDEVSYVLQNTGYQALFREQSKIDTGNPKYGERITCMMMFDETLIPWRRVFAYKDTTIAGKILANFNSSHSCVGAACKAGYMDSMAGIANLSMKSKGIENIQPLQRKLGKIIANTESTYAIAAGGASQGEMKKEIWLPNSLIANAANIAGVDKMEDAIRNLGEIVGGLPITAPSEEDLESEVGESVSKYLQAKETFSSEDSLKIAKFAQFWLASPHLLGAIHGGGSPDMALQVLQRLADIEFREEAVKRNLDL